jgi:hypothetical protein
MESATQLLSEDHSLWADAIAKLDALASRNFQLAGHVRAQLLKVVKSIETSAAYLPLDNRNIAEAKVRFLVRRKRLDELQQIDVQLKQEVLDLTDASRRTREAATAASSLLSSLTAPMSVLLAEALLAAVKLGDLGQVTASVARARKEAVPVALAVLQTTLPAEFLRPTPALRFDEPKVAPSTTRAYLVFNGQLQGFVPRDRVSQQVSNDAEEVLQFLLRRALQEMCRGSILGVLDHALDILLISTKDPCAGTAWTDVALSLIASLPSRPAAFTDWGERLADEFGLDLLQEEPMFPKKLAGFFAQSGFSDAVAERFVHKELAPISKDLAASLFESAHARSPHLLEDLARGIGAGARYGDVQLSKTLLTELAILAGCDNSTLKRLDQTLDGVQTDKKPPGTNWAPYWLAQGLQAHREATTERNIGSLRSKVRGSFNVQVPQSVQVSGGFVYTSGSDHVDLALHVGNPQALQCVAAELVVPAKRNSWLARDAVCYVGALPVKARLLAPLRLHLNQDLIDPGKIEIQTEFRFRDHSTSSTQGQDDKFALPFSKAASVNIRDYEGASGKPIILQGEALKLSSESVRQALTYIRHNLERGSVTALIIGRRRRGKTSILQTIAQDAETRRDYVIITTR